MSNEADTPSEHNVQRENARRGIFLTSELNWQTFEVLLPKIVSLRLASSEPICLFIDSPGGRVDAAEALIGQIRATNQDDRRCGLTTVCVGTAASVAADLLAAGDYAIAYKNSQILCHGTRHSRPQLTLEDVPSFASSIRENNEKFALRLASAVFRRLIFLVSMLPVEEKQTPLIHSVLTDPESLLQKIKQNLDQENQVIVDLTLKRQKKIGELIAHIDKKIQNRKIPPSPLKRDTEILKHVIDYEAKRAAAGSESLTPEHLMVIEEDFLQVKDYFSGQYLKRLSQVSRQFGHVFFDAKEKEEFHKIPELEKQQRNKFLVEKTSPKLFPFWYLVVSLCRILQQGEYVFSAKEALWIGLVDEALGTNLPCARKYIAAREKNIAKAASSSAPAPPSSQSQPASLG